MSIKKVLNRKEKSDGQYLYFMFMEVVLGVIGLVSSDLKIVVPAELSRRRFTEAKCR
jgi:hypothetical protein